jgi:signal transduction histidine kinase
MRSGRRSVRLKVFVLLVVPLISVIALWAFAASVTVGDARRQLRTNTITNNLVLPIAAVQNQLAPEGLLSVVAMGTHRPADRQALAVQRAHTDGAVNLLRTAVGSDKVRGATSDALRQELTGFLQTMTRLTEVRSSVDNDSGQRLNVVSAYFDLADQAEGVQEDIGAASLVDVQLYREALPLYPTGTGAALVSSEQAIILGAVSAGARSLTQPEIAAFAQATYNRRLVLEKLVADRVSPNAGSALKDILTSAPYVSLTLLEDRIIATPPGTPLSVDPKAFQAASVDVLKQYAAVTRPLGLALGDRASKAGRPVIIRLILAGGLGLIAVLLSLLLSFRFGRGLAKELTGLQAAAQDLADQRLPRIIKRLRNDEHIDVDAEAPPLKVGDTTEVGRVGDAFTTVQRTAIEAAIGQANLRRGVRQVFLNLARRSQSLLHRQLTMLDAMERKTNDPDALDELFRLDHLTTRMRRHAEGLIILSGALPARAWSTPVRVVDVVRAAIAEVESYTRVRVYVLSEASLQGAAVADVTHLIAELVENAASFSPPHTQVHVRAETVGTGFVIEIEDAGLGMTTEQMDDVNERLARPPDFDLADTDRLGLFVVAQLAARHNIKVTLRASPYGGSTAIVLLPAELMASEALSGSDADNRGRLRTTPRRDAELELPAIDGSPDAPVLTGRHRRLAGFLQRTRALQAPDPTPPPPPARQGNGYAADDNAGWYPAESPGGNGISAGTNGYPERPGGGAGQGNGTGGAGHGVTNGAGPDYPSAYADPSYGDPSYGDRPYGDPSYGDPSYGDPGARPDSAGSGRSPAGGSPGGTGAEPGWSHGGPARSDGWQPGPDAGRDTGRGAGWEAGPDAGTSFRSAERADQAPRQPYDRAQFRDRGADPPAGSPPRQYDQPSGGTPRGYQQMPAPRPAPDAGRADAGRADAQRADSDLGWDTSKFDLWAPTESAATSSGTHAGLPRRVRRASLAPQLRDAPAAGSEDDTDQDGAENLRSPEQARALMTSLQSGWRRGRTDAFPGSSPNAPTEEPR